MVQTAPVEWERPSERVRELIRHGAELVLNAQAEWLEELDQATLSAANVQELADDPALNAATRRSTRANLLHWAAANVSDPGAPVPANLGPEPLGIARDLVRRGLSESVLQAYRVGQNVAWQRWMAIAFALTSDPDELRELLDVSARSLFEFIDATIAGIAEQIQVERDELTRGTHAERREAVALILDGAPIGRQRAEARLGYNLEQTHTAAVIWGDEPECDSSQLDRATEALVHGADAQRPLSVIASATTRWVWVPGNVEPDLGRLEDVVNQMPGVRIAVGSTARGIEGFRRSHLDAITTQRMLARLNSAQRVAGFETLNSFLWSPRIPIVPTSSSSKRLASLRWPAPKSARRYSPSSTNSATLPARRRGSIPTETLCCDGFPGRSNYCRDRSGTTACTLPSRWTWFAGAAAAMPEATRFRPPSKSGIARTTSMPTNASRIAMARQWDAT